MSNNPSGPDAEGALALIREARVMTLGTADGEGGTWTAPVYYLFRSGKFYFFSNAKSRHIRMGAHRPCAASIFRDSDKSRDLQGIQMRGRLVPCTGLEALKPAAAYAAKYGLAVKGENPIDYFAAAFHAGLYAFLPDEIYFMDNTTGFGHREPVRL